MDSIRFNNKRKEMAISCWLKFISIENIYIYIFVAFLFLLNSWTTFIMGGYEMHNTKKTKGKKKKKLTRHLAIA